jgi:hypothetical protein
MSDNPQLNIKTLSILFGAILIIVVGLLTLPNLSSSQPPVPTSTPTVVPLARVQIGDSREEAVLTLSEGAWYHADCTDTGGAGDDIFFYGDRDGRTDIVVVSSLRASGEAKIIDLYDLQETYILNRYRERECIPEEVMNSLLPGQARTDDE